LEIEALREPLGGVSPCAAAELRAMLGCPSPRLAGLLVLTLLGGDLFGDRGQHLLGPISELLPAHAAGCSQAARKSLPLLEEPLHIALDEIRQVHLRAVMQAMDHAGFAGSAGLHQDCTIRCWKRVYTSSPPRGTAAGRRG